MGENRSPEAGLRAMGEVFAGRGLRRSGEDEVDKRVCVDAINGGRTSTFEPRPTSSNGAGLPRSPEGAATYCGYRKVPLMIRPDRSRPHSCP